MVGYSFLELLVPLVAGGLIGFFGGFWRWYWKAGATIVTLLVSFARLDDMHSISVKSGLYVSPYEQWTAVLLTIGALCLTWFVGSIAAYRFNVRKSQ